MQEGLISYFQQRILKGKISLHSSERINLLFTYWLLPVGHRYDNLQ